jgi:hypothetical protein
VLIDQIDAGVWIIKVGRFIPENERWLHQPDVSRDLDAAVQWAEKNPPAKSDLKILERDSKASPAAKETGCGCFPCNRITIPRTGGKKVELYAG